MKINGNYASAGYAHIEELFPAEVAKALLDQFWSDLKKENVKLDFARPDVLTNVVTEVYGPKYAPMTTFLWGATPIVSMITGVKLLPSYCFFRIYRRDDRLKIHVDRKACEHSVSLTLHYSDDEIWPFEIGAAGPASDNHAETFGAEPFTTILMRPGDAVLYRGPGLAHGRTSPNPNGWSAHLFMHWVDSDGPHRHLAFEEREKVPPTGPD
jgi:hypothetical protein